jgi:hypothetical protein
LAIVISTIARIRDGHIKISTAKYEHYVGSKRRAVNQMRARTIRHEHYASSNRRAVKQIRAGTVSDYMLLNIP